MCGGPPWDSLVAPLGLLVASLGILVAPLEFLEIPWALPVDPLRTSWALVGPSGDILLPPGGCYERPASSWGPFGVS